MIERKIRTYGDVELTLDGATYNIPRGIYKILEWNDNKMMKVASGIYVDVRKVCSMGNWCYLEDDPDYQIVKANPHLCMSDLM